MNNADAPNSNSINPLKIQRIKKREPTGITFRMLVLMIIFIALIFLSIFLSFNFFMEDYVTKDMRNQLSKVVQDVTSRKFVSIKNQIRVSSDSGGISAVINPGPEYYLAIYSAMTQSLRDTNSKTDVNAMIYYNIDYTVVFPTSSYGMFQDTDEMDKLVKVIKSNNFTEKDRAYKTSLASGNYYLTTVDLGEIYGLDGLSIAFYISSEKYDKFTEKIYSMLLIILLSATALTFVYVIFISRSISKPIQKLCGFADEIGRGNFRQNEYAFKDRELIDLNERMNETARKLEKNDDDQKTFFQNVSHELKTPLMSIKGYAEGIKCGVFSSEEEKNGASDIIISESDRLNDLVADLLYISKMDASKKLENIISADLGELVESCVGKLRGLLINSTNFNNSNNSNNLKSININHPKKHVYINCDEESLIRAIMNITSNCLRYAKSTIDISYWENEHGDVFLAIKDDGDGIDEKDLPNIFKRFYRGKGGKHGIGLSIAKTIIEQHNARITAKNRDDGINGAEFIIEFDSYFEQFK